MQWLLEARFRLLLKSLSSGRFPSLTIRPCSGLHIVQKQQRSEIKNANQLKLLASPTGHSASATINPYISCI